MRLVFMGTPQFAVPTLSALHQAGHDIAAVLCQPDRQVGRGRGIVFSPIKQKAVELAIPVLQPETLKTPQTLKTVSNLKPDAMVVVAYGLLLPQNVLNIPGFGAVNLHPSLLPKYRGAAPINHALINGEKTTGITSILMNRKMDAGDIIIQEKVSIAEEETAGELELRLSILGANLIIRSLDVLKTGNSKTVRQDEYLVTFAPKLASIDGHINWAKKSSEIVNLIRGVTPKPGAYGVYKDKRLEIIKVSLVMESQKLETDKLPGSIIKLDKNTGPVVKTGDGELILTEVKPQGKKAMGGDEFLRGYKPIVGDNLI